MDKDCITIDDYIKKGNGAYHNAQKMMAKLYFDKILKETKMFMPSDKLLYKTMTDTIKNKEENDVKTRFY